MESNELTPIDRLQQALLKMEPFRDVIERGDKVRVVINFAGSQCRVNIEYWEPKTSEILTSAKE